MATISTDAAAPVIAATRLRRGATSSAAGAVRRLRDIITTAQRCRATGLILVREDYGRKYLTGLGPWAWSRVQEVSK